MKLTKRIVQNIESDPHKNVHIWDDDISGFCIRVYPTGTKAFYLKYRTSEGGRRAKQRWVKIGNVGDFPIDVARKIAQQLKAEVARGIDPRAERTATRNAPTLAALWKIYEVEGLAEKKKSTAKVYRETWETIISPALGDRRVKMIAREDVDNIHKSMATTPYRANRTLAQISVLMNLAEAKGWRDQGTNPCKFVKKFKEEARKRYLSSAELDRLGDAMRGLVDDGRLSAEVSNLFKLLLMTGARKSEVTNSEWAWIDWDRQLMMLPDSKTGAKPLFLSDEALRVLRSQKAITHDPNSAYIFPGKLKDRPLVNLTKPWKLICEKAKLNEVRMHDLRHTAASIAVGQGVALPIIGRLLGHTQTQTTARYAHIDNDPALAAANVIGNALADSLA